MQMGRKEVGEYSERVGKLGNRRRRKGVAILGTG